MIRLSLIRQLIRQFNKGERIAAGGSSYVATDDGPAEQAVLERPIFLNGGVCGVDQVHFRKYILLLFSVLIYTEIVYSTIVELKWGTLVNLKFAPGEMLRASMLRRKMVVFYLLDLLE